MSLRSAVAGLVAGCWAGICLAATPVDVYEFPDAQLEARYRDLIAEFRCPLCLNTNLAGSDAPIAQDLRRTVHRLVVQEGASDDEVRAFLQQRYGDFVLYDPPLRWGTVLLWLGPGVFLMLGLWALWRTVHQPDTVPLTDQDRQALRRIVEEP